jgi:hypothetical protein
MKKSTFVSLLVALVLPLLAGCVNDAASMQIDGKEHSLSLVREQKWIWEQNLDLSVVVTRMPDCQRRHHLKSSPISLASVDVFSADTETFFLKQGSRVYSVETRTCESFQELGEIPADIKVLKYGTFRESKGQFAFIEDPSLPVISGQERPSAVPR